MNHKLRSAVIAAAGALTLGFGVNAMADTTDDLLNALIAKGVLTEEEGALLSKGRELEVATKKKTPQSKFNNGFYLENDDKSISLKIGGRMHADYRYFDRNIDSKTNTAGITNAGQESSTFDIRRARIELTGKVYDAYEFLVSADFASPNNGNTGSILDQAWLNVGYWKPLQFRFGQFKAPMSLEKMTSSNNLDFQERSSLNQLVANEDRGAMVWGIPKDGITYALAATTGEGAKNRNDADPRVDNMEFIGRSTVNFAQIMEVPNKDAVYHVGASASYTELSAATGNGYLSGTGNVRTEARGINYFSMPVINTGNVLGVDKAIERTRYGVEGAFAYNQFKVQSEWIRNNFSGNNTATNSFDKNIDAWYVEALWLITGEKYADSYKDGIWGGIKPKNNFELGKEGLGAWEAGIRYSKFDASDFNDVATATGAAGAGNLANITTINLTNSTLEADTWTAGIKFIPNPNFRFLLNYVDTSFDTPILIGTKREDKERAITARAQFNF